MDKVRSDTPKKQHYVPQFLLKNFSYGKKHRIFSFDKVEGNIFPTSVRDSASENGFYNLHIDGKEHTLEHKLSKLESVCGTVISNICREESLANIAPEEHTILCIFMSNLLLRVKKQRVFINQTNKSLIEWLGNMGINPKEVDNFDVLDKSDVNQLHIEFTHKYVLKFAKKFSNKPIALLKAPNGSNFIISDNPVVMHNHYDGNKGILVPGIEIQLPISKKLCLSFICVDLLTDLDKKMGIINHRKFQNLPVENIDTTYAEIILESARTGMAIEVTDKHTRFTNSLQIANSLRYIYSEKDSFKQAVDMVNKSRLS